MRASSLISFAAMAALGAGCVGVKPPPVAKTADGSSAKASESAASGTGDARLDKFVSRLNAVSAAAQMIKARPADADHLAFALAIDESGKVAGGPREALSFEFKLVPYQEGMPGGPDGFAGLNATLAVDSNRKFVIAMAFTGKTVELGGGKGAEGAGADAPTTFESVRVMIARETHGEPSKAGRLAAAKLWNLVGENIETPYERAAFDAVALGTRLQRQESPPSFAHPGAGTWTLLRLVEPGDAYLAIDWTTGKGEFIPKASGERSGAGLALFKAL